MVLDWDKLCVFSYLKKGCRFGWKGDLVVGGSCLWRSCGLLIKNRVGMLGRGKCGGRCGFWCRWDLGIFRLWL